MSEKTDKLKKALSLHQTLADRADLQEAMAYVIKVGEASGNVPGVLSAAKAYNTAFISTLLEDFDLIPKE